MHRFFLRNERDQRIDERFVCLAPNGVESEMGDIVDEPTIMAIPQEQLTGVIKTPRSIGPAV